MFDVLILKCVCVCSSYLKVRIAVNRIETMNTLYSRFLRNNTRGRPTHRYDNKMSRRLQQASHYIRQGKKSTEKGKLISNSWDSFTVQIIHISSWLCDPWLLHTVIMTMFNAVKWFNTVDELLKKKYKHIYVSVNITRYCSMTQYVYYNADKCN
jgi:hypothetical protein